MWRDYATAARSTIAMNDLVPELKNITDSFD